MEHFLDYLRDLVIFIVAGIILISVILTPLAFLDYQGKKSACAEWQVETDRQVKFVSDVPFYWDCLIKTESGWISGSKLEQIESPNIHIDEEQNQ